MAEPTTEPESSPRPPHVFTVEVEEYFQAPAFEWLVSPCEWSAFPSRLELALDELLGALDRHGVSATFFVVGWLAEQHPGLIRSIAQAGHEVASHGWRHRPAEELSVAGFREEVRRSKRVLEEVTGTEIAGYRAASWSLRPNDAWAFEILVEEGYRYDSSVRRVSERTASLTEVSPSSASPFPILETRSGTIAEVSPQPFQPWRLQFPTGGSYFRLLPLALTRRQLEAQRTASAGGVFYLRTWELDEHHPALPTRLHRRLLHYGGLSAVGAKLDRLLSGSTFTSVRRLGQSPEEQSFPSGQDRFRRMAL